MPVILLACNLRTEREKLLYVDNKFVRRESLHKMYPSDIYIGTESVTEWGYMSDSRCNCLKAKAQNRAPSGPRVPMLDKFEQTDACLYGGFDERLCFVTLRRQTTSKRG